MVAEQEIQCAAALAHCDPLTIRVVVLDHRARTAGPLEMVADVAGSHAVQHGFDAVAVAVAMRLFGSKDDYALQYELNFLHAPVCTSIACTKSSYPLPAEANVKPRNHRQPCPSLRGRLRCISVKPPLMRT